MGNPIAGIAANRTSEGMKVDTMRRIDRYAGVPLCAIASVLVRLWSLLPRSPRPVQRVLFIELSEMGTTVLAQPAMRKAREQLGAELFFLIFKRNVAALDLLGMFPPANVFTIRDTSIFHLAWDVLSFLFWAWRRRIDTVVEFELFSRLTALLTGFSGADRRVGFDRFHYEGLYRGSMLTHRVTYNPHQHISKNLIALVDALLVAEPQLPYSKTVIGDDQLTMSIPRPSAAACDAVAVRIRALAPDFDPARQRLVLINPNTSQMLPQRRWMPERYAELIRRILATHADVVVLITGSPDEREEAVALASGCGARCIAFAGHTGLGDLSALYALSSVIVTNDSGPGHFAAPTGLPTVVLFGPETPTLYLPLGNARAIYAGLACSPCVSAFNHRKTACTDNVCMKAISVEQVLAAVTDILSDPRQARRA